MQQPLKKEAESTPLSQDLPSTEAQKPQKRHWGRMEGESTLWFNRFVRYRKLGPKRSLQAAFEEERSQIAALKSTGEDKKGAARPKQKRGKNGTVSHLNEVPKPLQVPGSWKQASIKFRWVERAQSFDAWQVDRVTEEHINDIVSDAAIGLERVKILKEMCQAMRAQFYTNHNKMTYEQEFACIARIQSLLRDIREEMSIYDESLSRILVRRSVQDVYNTATPEELKTGRIEKKSKS